jgi:hypothetical protein
MILDLIQQLEYQNIKFTDAFYNHLPRLANEDNGILNPFTWKVDSTGYYVIGNSSVSYFSLIDGKVFRLVRWYHQDDNNMLKDLMQISNDTKQFRIEQFITDDVIMHNGTAYLYTETVRPNNEAGIHFIEASQQSDPKIIFENFIDQTAFILPHIDNLVAKYGHGPMLLSLNIHSNWEKDSLGFYWKNLRLFKTSKDIFINRSFNILLYYIKLIELIQSRNDLITPLKNYAEEKWL